MLARLLISALFSLALAEGNASVPQELNGVGVEERLGTVLDGNLEFVAENGRPTRLSTFLRQGRPVILNFVYYSCPMLCSLVMNGLTSSIRELSWTPGQEYEIVTVSIDPREMYTLAAAKKQAQLISFDRPAPGWHFLSDYNDNARKLADQAGFRYRWDKDRQQYAHSAALVLLTPEGKIARYLYGIKYKPFDLRMGLTEARDGKMRSTGEHLLLYCFQYDPAAKSYVLFARNIMRGGGALTVFIVGASLLRFWRRERENLKQSPLAGPVSS
ncbi:MAG: SCO family protein [Acidobacteriaceae bacterium]|nr:SCO family protein [Acidobacteriaceae bacterium]